MKNSENALTPTMRKMLGAQSITLAILSIASIIGGIWLAIDSYGYNWITIPVALVVCYLLMQISGFISTFVLKRIYYGSDSESFVNDARSAFAARDEIMKEQTQPENESNTEQIVIKIVATSEGVLARYMDHDIFEWIEIADVNGNPVRLSFIGTMDLSKGLIKPVPNGCMLIEPGILYGTDEALAATA